MPRRAAWLIVVLAGLAVPAPADARPTNEGTMTLGAGPVRSGSQGALWQSRFVERRRGRVTYTACVVSLTRKGYSTCMVGRTGKSGTSRRTFAEFVNQQPGRWAVRFFITGRQVAGWRFTVRSEGV